MVTRRSIIRLAAGRTTYTEEAQAMCFLAGANAIFTGHRMLTTETNGWDEDAAMFERWGMSGLGSFENERVAKADKQSHPSAEPEARQEQPVAI